MYYNRIIVLALCHEIVNSEYNIEYKYMQIISKLNFYMCIKIKYL